MRRQPAPVRAMTGMKTGRSLPPQTAEPPRHRHVPSLKTGLETLAGLLRMVEELARVDHFAPHVIDGLRHTAERIEATHRPALRSSHPDTDRS